MVKIKNKLKESSVTVQVILLISILIIPINIISIVSTNQVRNAFLQQKVESAVNTAAIYMGELDRRIYSADTFLAKEIDDNTYVLRMRRHEKGTQYWRESAFYWQELNKRAAVNVDADGYFFCIENENFLNLAMNDKYTVNRKEVQEYLKAICRNGNRKTWFYRKIGQEKWMICLLSLDGYYYGAVINLSDLEMKFQKSFSMEGTKVSYSEVGTQQVKTGIKEICSQSEKSAIGMYILLDTKVLLKQIPLSKQIGLWIAFGYLTCIPIIFIILKKILIRPMNRINQAMEELENGNADYRIATSAENKEAKELNQKFNSMADKLKNLKIQVYETELENRDIEATNLRLQVNPHFILNCLNIIFSLARSGNTENVKVFTKYLADYLRFLLWHTSGKVLLKEEIHCLENYLEIQKIRFPGTFTYIKNIDTVLMNVQIPSLLILNFVENAIKYALRMGSEIEIIVIVRKDGECLTISICDTGNGMDEKTLTVLRNGGILENESGKHIGIWNCKRRLKMMYQEKASINITSQEGEGTQIFIQLPLEENNK